MESNTIRLMIMLSLTASFFIVELVVGFTTKTLSLVADSFHMLSDALAMIVGIIAIRISKRSKNSKMTYGYHRAQIVGGLINGITLLTLCFTILVDAIERYIEPEEIKNHVASLSVGCVGLAINILGMFIFHGHAHLGHDHGHDHDHDHDHHDHKHKEHDHKYKEHDHKHKKHDHKHKEHNHKHKKESKEKNDEEYEMEDKNPSEVNVELENSQPSKPKNIAMHSVFLHILGDALGSLAVIASVLFSWLTKFSWKVYVDPTASIIIVVILCVGTVPLVKKTIAIVMQQKPGHIDIEKIEKKLKRIDGVITIHDLHIWQLDESKLIASFHILCKEGFDVDAISRSAKAILHDASIHSTTIQIETTVDEEDPSCLLKCDDEECAPYLCCDEDEPLLQQD